MLINDSLISKIYDFFKENVEIFISTYQSLILKYPVVDFIHIFLLLCALLYFIINSRKNIDCISQIQPNPGRNKKVRKVLHQNRRQSERLLKKNEQNRKLNQK